MLRVARPTDLEGVYALCSKFFQQTQYGHIQLNETDVKSLIEDFIAPDQRDRTCLLWLVDEKPVGILAGNIYTIPFLGKRVAIEALWWVDPEVRGGPAGGELLNAFEFWADLQKADFIQMMSLPNRIGKALDRLYKKRGYTLTELTYTKELH